MGRISFFFGNKRSSFRLTRNKCVLNGFFLATILMGFPFSSVPMNLEHAIRREQVQLQWMLATSGFASIHARKYKWLKRLVHILMV